ncbi:MAG: hypothetical protein M3O20_04140 [Acidobacteriota bacterium]|nr:hypothetical protein [Acidobacteriota bacterium]
MKLALSASIGAEVGGRGVLQAPQRPLSARWAAGMRLLARQDGQRVMTANGTVPAAIIAL